MGTDIIAFAERGDSDDVWRYVPMCIDFGRDRDYSLFGILAGVRSDGIEPIVPPRGLPDDVLHSFASHPRVGCYHTYTTFCEENHSASWLLVSEIQAAHWRHKQREFPVYLDSDNFRRYISGEQYSSARVPCSYPPDGPPVPCPQRHWMVVSQDEMRLQVEAGTATDQMRCLVWASESYEQLAQGLLQNVLPSLEALGHPDRVRLVYYFDD